MTATTAPPTVASPPLTAVEAQERAALVEQVNAEIRASYARLPWDHPVGRVQWVHLDKIRANEYNPNSVAASEMTLLHTSITEDGYTMPIVVIEDDNRPGFFEIVDGFHRYTTMRRFPDIFATTGGYLPVAVIDKPLEDRIASTVRHNRARGKHSIAGMGNLVFQMLEAGDSDAEVCNKLGLEAEELARLKHITGYSKLYAATEFSHPVLGKNQLEAKAEYHKAHPDEPIPQF